MSICQTKLPLLKGKRILQVLPSLGQGGVERGTLEVAQAIQQAQGHAWVASNSGPLVDNLIKIKAQHCHLPLKSKNPFTIFLNIYRLYKLIRQEKIDLIHARSRAPAWSAFWAARLAGIPFMTTFHGSYNFTNFLKKYYNSVMVRGNTVIAISTYIYDHILKNYQNYRQSNQITIIPRGVDLDVFNKNDPTLLKRIQRLKTKWQIDENYPIILLVGRLTRWKGQETALKSLGFLKNFKGILVCLGSDQGRISYLESLKTLAKSLDIQNRVYFIPTCDDMPAAYAMADLALHTSTDPEAFGRTIIEAQSMGKCVIATAHGAPVDIIQEGITGYLIAPQDPQKLANSIQHYFTLSSQEKENISRAAFDRIKSLFSKDQMMEKTLKVYQDLLQKGKS
ncbi:MAG: glycosyltransferase family 4 protein [Janthinobacterium lividum]